MTVTGQMAPHGGTDSTTTAAHAIIAALGGEPDWLHVLATSLVAATDVVSEGSEGGEA